MLNNGIASQLRPNRDPLLIFLNVFYDGLRAFRPPGGWRAGCSCAGCRLSQARRFVLEFSFAGWAEIGRGGWVGLVAQSLEEFLPYGFLGTVLSFCIDRIYGLAVYV